MLTVNDELQVKIKQALSATADASISRQSISCLDLTSLSGQETSEDLKRLCDTARVEQTASVCVYAPYIEDCGRLLGEAGVNIATVINFPTGNKRSLSNEAQTDQTISEDVSKAVAAGAGQVDIVFPYDEFLAGDIAYAQEALEACRSACPENVTMMVILETAAFTNEEELRAACELSVECGTNSLKTSTGKHKLGGATMEAAAVLLDVAEKSDRFVGVKISGGVKTADHCAQYIALSQAIRPDLDITPESFRIGASGVITDLVAVARGNVNTEETKMQPNLDY